MMSKNRRRDVDCDIVCRGWERGCASQCIATASRICDANCCARRSTSVLRALPAATTAIIVKNIHLQTFKIHFHTVAILFKQISPDG